MWVDEKQKSLSTLFFSIQENLITLKGNYSSAQAWRNV